MQSVEYILTRHDWLAGYTAECITSELRLCGGLPNQGKEMEDSEE